MFLCELDFVYDTLIPWCVVRLSDVVKGSAKGRHVAEDSSSNSNGGIEDKDSSSPTHLSSQSVSALPQTLDK